MSSPPEDDIRRTLARYCMFLDDGRLDDFVELFAEHATLQVDGRAIEGRDAIAAFIGPAMAPDRLGKHIAASPLVEVDGWGGTAKAWGDYIFVDPSGAITEQGRYHDELAREGDKVWRLTSREIVARGDAPVASKPPPG